MKILLILGVVLILVGMFVYTEIDAHENLPFLAGVVCFIVAGVVKFVRSRRVGRFSSKQYDNGGWEMPKKKGIIEGVARNVSLVEEDKKQGCNPFSGLMSGLIDKVLRFRVEVTDKEGNIVEVVPVEIRGTAILGDIANGDSVRVKGKKKYGIVIAKEVVNKTTSSIVREK